LSRYEFEQMSGAHPCDSHVLTGVANNGSEVLSCFSSIILNAKLIAIITEPLSKCGFDQHI